MDIIRSKKRILIVDDSKTQLGFFKIHFTNAGYEVITASCVDEAFIKIFEYPPDVILSDVIMENVSGFQLCKMLKKNIVLKNIPIVIFTSSMDVTSNAFWALKAKADKFISKNSDIKEIIEVVDEVSNGTVVAPEIKEKIAENRDKAESLFLENKIVSDKEWMKSTITNEFKYLSKYIDSPSELMQKLFGILSIILRYDLCFVVLNKQNANHKLDLYTNSNYAYVDSEALNKLSQDFIQKVFKEDKAAQLEVINTNIKSEENINYIDAYKNELIIPIEDDRHVHGAIGFYYKTENNPTNGSYFDDIVNEISILIQNKIYSENLNFLSYNNSNAGIYNRFQFLDNLSIELARTKLNNKSVSVVMFAFDNYDEISSRYGVDIANLAIKKAVQQVTSSLRFPDKVYRYNHQTLLMILANVDAQHSKVPMERIARQLNEYKINFDSNEFMILTKVLIIDNNTPHNDAEDLFNLVLSKFENTQIQDDNRILIYNETAD